MTDSGSQNRWQAPLRIFSEVTGLIVVPIVAALYLGKWLDKKYNSEPWFFISMAVIGITISAIFVYRIASRYIKETEKEIRKSNYYDHSHGDRIS